ncbi:MAG: glycosyltransferase family 4 protein [Candidatus Helarchaeota archaeon]
MNKYTSHENFFYKGGLFYYYGNNSIIAIITFLINLILSLYHSQRIKKLDIDVIHCHFIPSALIAFFTKKPTLVFVNESANSYPKIWLSFLRFFLKNSILVYISYYNQDYWSKILKKKGIIIYYAVDREIFNPKIKKDRLKNYLRKSLNCDYIIISMGGMNEDRGFEKIIKAVSRINKMNSYKVGLILKIYGKGSNHYRSKISQLLQTMVVPAKIISKRLSTEELAQLLGASDIFIRSNKNEGFGIAPLEAMSCGTPLILTKTQCHLEIFGGPSLFYKFNDIDDLKLKIEKLLIDQKFREEQVGKGISKAKKYSWDKRINKFLKIYAKLNAKLNINAV